MQVDIEAIARLLARCSQYLDHPSVREINFSMRSEVVAQQCRQALNDIADHVPSESLRTHYCVALYENGQLTERCRDCGQNYRASIHYHHPEAPNA